MCKGGSQAAGGRTGVLCSGAWARAQHASGARHNGLVPKSGRGLLRGPSGLGRGRLPGGTPAWGWSSVPSPGPGPRGREGGGRRAALELAAGPGQPCGRPTTGTCAPSSRVCRRRSPAVKLGPCGPRRQSATTGNLPGTRREPASLLTRTGLRGPRSSWPGTPAHISEWGQARCLWGGRPAALCLRPGVTHKCHHPGGWCLQVGHLPPRKFWAGHRLRSSPLGSDQDALGRTLRLAGLVTCHVVPSGTPPQTLQRENWTVEAPVGGSLGTA